MALFKRTRRAGERTSFSDHVIALVKDPGWLRRELNVARTLHKAVTEEFAHRAPRPEELWQLLSRFHNVLRMPTTSEDLDPARYVLGLYWHLRATTRSRNRKMELDTMRRQIADTLGVEEEETDPDLSASGNPVLNQLPVRRPKRKAPQPQTMRLKDAEAAAPAATTTIDHALARLFIRLGPPPVPTAPDHVPAGSNGGGAQQ
ncbi:hypothetical protein [Streptomyces phaeochromogenes]|uniref:hypothetical protein n=1 Tax=Streptomyces phaeochromogenes TaxID=1923 RepID=UPI0036755D19